MFSNTPPMPPTDITTYYLINKDTKKVICKSINPDWVRYQMTVNKPTSNVYIIAVITNLNFENYPKIGA
jgi:hypothetical protein